MADLKGSVDLEFGDLARVRAIADSLDSSQVNSENNLNLRKSLQLKDSELVSTDFLNQGLNYNQNKPMKLSFDPENPLETAT